MRFVVDFDPDGQVGLGQREALLDEPPPLGEGAGPNAARLVAAAVGNCLAASLLYCLQRARAEVGEVAVTVTGTLVRNEAGRLRIGSLSVELDPQLSDGAAALERCLPLFEQFCVVTESVRAGIPVSVKVGGREVASRPSEG